MCVFQADWVHRFEACSDYMHKLLPVDVTQFIDAIVFVPRSLQQVGHHIGHITLSHQHNHVTLSCGHNSGMFQLTYDIVQPPKKIHIGQCMTCIHINDIV